jgi:DNA-directed RNA polymerase III subunit RPC6
MESKDNSARNINEKILSFLKSNPDGVSQEKLTSAIPFSENAITDALNNLYVLNRISYIESSNGILFKYRSEKEALKFRDLSKEENAVYEVVMQSGSNGISTIDIKIKLKINNTTYVNKILNKLSKKLLIKNIKVLNTRNKKVWMGIDVEPSQEVIGGIWCNNHEFDDQLVNVFCEKCTQYIGTQKQVSRNELLFFAKSTNLTQNQEIKEDDIQKIINILVFDGKIEPIFPLNIDNKYLGNKYALLLDKGNPEQELIRYRKMKESKSNNIYEYLPCFVCTSFKECKKDNVVNPMECPFNKALFKHIEEFN